MKSEQVVLEEEKKNQLEAETAKDGRIDDRSNGQSSINSLPAPESFEIVKKLPRQEKISIFCSKCKNHQEIVNPTFSDKGKHFFKTDLKIYRQSGTAYRAASIVALVPAVWIFINVESWLLRIVLWLVVCIPLFKIISEAILRLLGAIHQVGYAPCNACHARIFLAYNKTATKLLRVK